MSKYIVKYWQFATFNLYISGIDFDLPNVSFAFDSNGLVESVQAHK